MDKSRTACVRVQSMVMRPMPREKCEGYHTHEFAQCKGVIWIQFDVSYKHCIRKCCTSAVSLYHAARV